MNTNYSLSGKAIVTTVAQSSSYLVLGLDDGRLHVFSTQGEVLYKLRAEFSPSSLTVRQHQLIVGCRDGSIESWDLFTGYVPLAGVPSSIRIDLVRDKHAGNIVHCTRQCDKGHSLV
jgi:WD40 repeat protein